MTRILPLDRLGSALDNRGVEYISELYPEGVIVSEKLLSEILQWDRGEEGGMFNRLYPLILGLLSPSELKEVMLLSIQNRWRLVGEAIDNPELIAAWTSGLSSDKIPQTLDDAVDALPSLRAFAETVKSEDYESDYLFDLADDVEALEGEPTSKRAYYCALNDVIEETQRSPDVGWLGASEQFELVGRILSRHER
jgi:hypothetical protein